jgi:hypothetical protein
MRIRALAALALLLLAGCVSASESDHDPERPKAEQRTKKYCLAVAKAHRLHVEKVGRIAKVTARRYEVQLRIEPTKEQPGQSTRVLCRYDDETRSALLD